MTRPSCTSGSSSWPSRRIGRPPASTRSTDGCRRPTPDAMAPCTRSPRSESHDTRATYPAGPIGRKGCRPGPICLSSAVMKADLQSKRISPDDAAALVKSGDWVEYGGGVGQPDLFDQALARRKHELRGVKIRAVITMSPRAVLEA